MKPRSLLILLALALTAFPLNAASVDRSPKDTLSADGPYILYGMDGGARVISVDTSGNISDDFLDPFPDNYTFLVTDHRGEYPFEVSLRPFAREDWHIPSANARTFVMSDPHGRLDCVVSLLQGNRVIDKDLRWSYGTDRLIVIGDICDRGYDVTSIYWLFYKLQQEAREAGGAVTMLLGNHEPMLFAGDERYAKPKYTVLARLLGMKYKDLMGPDSELGRWIASWNVISVIGSNLYVHAGLGKDFYDWNLPVAEINAKMSEALFMKNSARKAASDTLKFLFGSYGPIWYRGLVSEKPSRRPLAADSLALIRQRFGVDHIIVGHTIFRDVSTFYDGQVIDVNVDNRVNRRKNRGRALLIDNGQYIVVGDRGKKRNLKLNQQLPH